MAKAARKWNPSLHPRDARGRFTKSSTRVMKGTDTTRARSALTGFTPAKIGAEDQARAWIESRTGKPLSEDSALSRYLAGGWKETNPAIRSAKTPPPEVAEIDAEFDELDEDVVLRRQVPLQMFAHIPVDDLVGMKVRDAAYASTSLDRPDAGPSAPDAVTMHIAAAAGTLAFVNGPDGEILLARDTEIAVTRAEPNGRGGWDVYGAVIPKTAVKRDGRAAGAQDDDETSPPADGGEAPPAAGADQQTGDRTPADQQATPADDAPDTAPAAPAAPAAAADTETRRDALLTDLHAAERRRDRARIKAINDELDALDSPSQQARDQQALAGIADNMRAAPIDTPATPPDAADQQTGDQTPAAGTRTPSDAGEPAELATDGPLGEFAPLDRERIRVAVEDHAARYYASPMTGGSQEDAARYVSEGPLGKLSDRQGLGPVWKAVSQVLDDRPDLMTRTPEESDRAATDRAERVNAMSGQAAQLTKDGDFEGALALIDQAEQIAPDHRTGKPVPTRSWDDLRALVRRRAGQAPAVAGDAAPADGAPAGDGGKPVTYPRLWHTAPPASAEAIRAGGFRSGEGRGPDGQVGGGAFFGAGVYLSTDQAAADRYLDGVRAYQYSDAEQVTARARVTRPFVVNATGTDADPGGLMRRHLVDAGLAQPGEQLTPREITNRLQQAGHDGVEVRQPEANDEIGGSQLLVFDPADVELTDGDQQQTGDGTPAAGTSAPGGATFADRIANAQRGSDALHSVPLTYDKLNRGVRDTPIGGKPAEPVIKSLDVYRGGGFMTINPLLRLTGGDPGKMKKEKAASGTSQPPRLADLMAAYAEYGAYIEYIDAAHADSPLPQDTELWRGFQNPRAVFGDAWNDDDVTGLEWVDHGYSSATTSEEMGRRFAGLVIPTTAGAENRVVLRILAPKGMGAVQLSSEQYESELLLPRGVRFRVAADRQAVDGARYLDVEVLSHEGPDREGARGSAAGGSAEGAGASSRAAGRAAGGGSDEQTPAGAEDQPLAATPAAGTSAPTGGAPRHLTPAGQLKRPDAGVEAARLDAASGGFTPPPLPEITGDMTVDERLAAMSPVSLHIIRLDQHIKWHEPKPGLGDYYSSEIRGAHGDAEHARSLVTNTYEAADLLPARLGRLRSSLEQLDNLAQARDRRAKLTRSANPDPANNPTDAVLAIDDILRTEIGKSSIDRSDKPMLAAAAAAIEGGVPIATAATLVKGVADNPMTPEGEGRQQLRDLYAAMTGQGNATPEAPRAADAPTGDVTPTPTPAERAEGMASDAAQRMQTGDYDGALELIDQAAQIAPDHLVGKKRRSWDDLRALVRRRRREEQASQASDERRRRQEEQAAQTAQTAQAGDETPAADTSVSPDNLVAARERLATSVASGVATREELTEGASALVERIMFNDGTEGIHKRTSSMGGRGAREQQDAEELGALVLAAFGVRSPAIHRDNERAIYAQYIHGRSGMALAEAADDERAVTREHMQSDAGRRMALADLVMDNIDRNSGNWIVDRDGELYGIDHGMAFFHDGDADISVGWLGNPNLADPNDIDPADLAAVRERLAALRPEFERVGRVGWHDTTLARLDALTERVNMGRDKPTGDETPAAGASAPETPTAPEAPAPAAPAAPATYADRRDQLAVSVESGITDREQLTGGFSGATVELVTFNDGSRAVRKVTRGDDEGGRPAAEEQDAEELAAAMAAAVGAPVAAVHRAGPDEVYVEYAPGRTGMELPLEEREREVAELADSDAGRLLGLADLLMSNGDRNHANYLVDDGRLVGIDHGFAWWYAAYGPDRPSANDAQPFSRGYIKWGGDYGLPSGWADHDLTPADIAEARRRVEALRPEFDRLGHTDWHDFALARLDAVGAHATGDRNRIAEGDDISAPPRVIPANIRVGDMVEHDGEWSQVLKNTRLQADPEVQIRKGNADLWVPASELTGHRQGTDAPDDDETPAADPRVSPDDVRSAHERIAASVASGVGQREPLGEGFFAESVELVTFNDGDRGVFKKARDNDRPAAVQQDAEELGALLLGAFGVRAPAVHRDGPADIYLEYIDGRLGMEGGREAGRAFQGQIAETDGGRLLGLADAVMDNTDRHPGNWIVDRDGDLVGIDHGNSFLFPRGDSTAPPRHPVGFVSLYVDRDAGDWADNDLSPADIAEARTRLAALRPEFERLGHADWHDTAVARLDAIGAHATGDRNRIAEGDDTGAPAPAAGTRAPAGDRPAPRNESEEYARGLTDAELLDGSNRQMSNRVRAAVNAEIRYRGLTTDGGPDDGPDTGDGGTGGVPRPPTPDTGPAGPAAAPAGPAQQADMFGGATDFVPAGRAALGMTDRANVGRERGMAAVQQLGMFDISDQQQMDGQMAMLDALLEMPAGDTAAPPPPAPRAPEPAAAPAAPASIVPDDLSGWNDEQLAELFRTVGEVDNEADVDQDGLARIMGEWERRETAMAELVGSVPDDLTPLSDDDVEGLYARLTGELGTLDNDTVERLGAELDRRQEAERLAAANAPKRAMLDRPVGELTDDEIETAAAYAADLADAGALERVYAESERRDAEREQVAERERLEREAQEHAEREAALQAARDAERRAAAEHAEAQRDRMVDAMAAAQDAAVVPAYDNMAVGSANTALGEDGLRALFGDAVVDEWVADVPGGASNTDGRWTAMQRRLIALPASDRVRLVAAAAEQGAAKEFADYSDRELQTLTSQGMFSTESLTGVAPVRERGRRAGREANRRKIQKLREDNAREFRQFQIRAMAADPGKLTDEELTVAPTLVTATGGADVDIEARLTALRAEAQRREVAAGEAAEAKAAGPAAPARYLNPVPEYGYLRRMVAGSNAKDVAAQDRLRRAQAAVYGLPEDADAKAIKAAEKKDPRPVADQAAAVTAWFRHLGKHEGVDQGDQDWYRGKPDDPDVPDTPTPLPPANISKPDEVWNQILANARQELNDDRFDTATRLSRALARTYRIPAEDVEPNIDGIRRLQQHTSLALQNDHRTEKQRAADFLAQYRALAAEDGVDPSDTLRYGPPDKATRRTGPASWRESRPDQQKRIDELVARGWDWMDAYAEVHGVSSDALRAEQARAASGSEKDRRQAYAEYVELQYMAAEAATNGYMIKNTSASKDIDPKRLFSGPWSTARAHASEELLRWWGENPRLTYADFKAQLAGGADFRASRERLISAGKGNEFA